MRAGAVAYSATAGAWQRGPARIYDRLAEILISFFPVRLDGLRVLDVGAGTGAATRAALTAGAAGVVAVDFAWGMLAHDARRRPPAALADALALPFASRSFDAAVAAFCLNHLSAPAAGLREMARVTRPGGALLATAYAADDTHPVRAAVEGALTARGWTPEPWYLDLRAEATPLLATAEGCSAAAGAAGLDAQMVALRVSFDDLDARALVAWRLGLAQHAPFMAQLSPRDRDALENDALDRLGHGAPRLERSILMLRALSP